MTMRWRHDPPSPPIPPLAASSDPTPPHFHSSSARWVQDVDIRQCAGLWVHRMGLALSGAWSAPLPRCSVSEHLNEGLRCA